MSAQCATVTSMIKTTSSSSAAIAKMLFIQIARVKTEGPLRWTWIQIRINSKLFGLAQVAKSRSTSELLKNTKPLSRCPSLSLNAAFADTKEES